MQIMKTKTLNWIKIAALLCIVACIADFIILFVLGNYYPGYSQLKNTMSSLAASVSPVSNMLSLWWVVLGFVFIFFGFHFKKAFDHPNKNVKIASWLIILYGLGEGIGSGLFKADITAGKMTNSFLIHDFVGGIGIVAALLLPLFMRKIVSLKNNSFFNSFSWIVFIVSCITIMLFTIRFSSEENSLIRLYRGLWQRLFLFNFYVYLITISVIIYNNQRRISFHNAKK